MARKSLAAVQRGVPLADIVRPASRRRAAKGRKKRARSRAFRTLKGPFLSHGILTPSERRRLVDGIRTVLEGAFTHLPLKRARYGFDPVQRLNILRTQIDELSDDAFHYELADIVTRLRDFHTTYAGPETLKGKVAALPFMVEAVGPISQATYIVTKVMSRTLDSSFKPGVTLEYWNGVPIRRALQRYSDRGQGGRPDTAHAWAVGYLTLRALQYGPPPDEEWVIIGYRTAGGQAKEIKIDWKIVDPTDVADQAGEAPEGARGKAARRTLAVNPAAQAIRQAKMLLFAPQALRGETPRRRRRRATRNKRAASEPTVIATNLTQSLKAMSLPARDGPFGYLRIWAFDDLAEDFIPELIRLIELLPDNGLIIDIRGNPGGYIWAAELALQLFTPNHIEPTRFSPAATPFMREIATAPDLVADLEGWQPSLEAAVRNGELYAQPLAITEVGPCNALGQRYGGPVVLVGDSATYSAGDLFTAGFVDNKIGPFICVGSATGAGGANVWSYGELRDALRGSNVTLPKLPEGIDMTFSFRRATRIGKKEGLPIEDVGVAGEPYAMTTNDVLEDNRDLMAHCIAQLRTLPFSRMNPTIDEDARQIHLETKGLDCIGISFDSVAQPSKTIADGERVTIEYARRTKVVELTGFVGGKVVQRRRLPV